MPNVLPAKAYDGAVPSAGVRTSRPAKGQGTLRSAALLSLLLPQKRQRATGTQRHLSLRQRKALARLFSMCSPHILQETIRYVKMLRGPIK